MLNLYEKIANLTEKDYSSSFDMARLLDYANGRAKEALKRRDLAELRYLNGAIQGWLSSSNKWKERYRRLLININRVEQDLESLSLRIKRMTGEAESQLVKDKRAALVEEEKAPITPQDLTKTYELPSISES